MPKKKQEQEEIIEVTPAEENTTEEKAVDNNINISAPAEVADNNTVESTDGAESEYILEVEDLSKVFPIKKNLLGKPVSVLKAVNNVSFKVKRGTTIGVVGESGCGKTTLGRTILRLYDADGGKIVFNGDDITKIKRKQMRKYRTDIQLIFQDPYSSLPPRMTVGGIIGEAVKGRKLAELDIKISAVKALYVYSAAAVKKYSCRGIFCTRFRKYLSDVLGKLFVAGRENIRSFT